MVVSGDVTIWSGVGMSLYGREWECHYMVAIWLRVGM